MTEIVFDELITSPDTQGDISLAGRVVVRMYQVAPTSYMSIAVEPATASLAEYIAYRGDLSVQAPRAVALLDNYIPGIITTVSGSMFAYGPSARANFYEDAPEAPQYGEISIDILSAAASMTAFSATYGAIGLTGGNPVAFLRTTLQNEIAVIAPPAQLRLFQTVAPVTTRIYATVQPVGSALASLDYVISSDFAFSDSFFDDFAFVVQSRINFTAAPEFGATLAMLLQTNVLVQDTFRFLFEMSLQDNIALADNMDGYANLVLQLATDMVLSDETIPWMSAIMVAASAVVLADALKFASAITIESPVLLGDLFETNLAAVTTLVSEVLLIDEMTALMHAFIVAESSIMVEDDFINLLTALMEIDDGIAVTTRFVLPDGYAYTGYVVNVRTTAVGTLTNYPFNSFARLDLGGGVGIILGAAQDGIYKLGGDTDAGALIKASVRTGLTDFGTAQLKRVPNAYLGYTSTGQLLLKTITTDGGKKQENWYKLSPRHVPSPDGTRFDIAKGLTARYWGWSVENVDGAKFSISDMRLWPMVMMRRKSGR